MDLKDIKLLIRLVDEKRFAEFELEKGDFKLRIKRNESPVIQYAESPSVSLPHQASVAIAHTVPDTEAPPSSPVRTAEAEADGVVTATDLHMVTSPIVGTFYRSPSPTSDPFVQIGDRVGPGTILCIVEAMKLMNEIPSDVSGEVVKILVENGQPVEYGQPLFGIKVEA